MFRSLPEPRALGSVVAAFAIAGLLLAGCGDDDESSGATASGDGATPDLEGSELAFLSFGGETYDYMDDHWFQPFEDASGARVLDDSPMDYAKIEAQVDAGKVSYDLVDGEEYVIEPVCGEIYETIEVSTNGMQPQYQPKSDCVFPGYVYVYVLASDTEAFPDGGPKDCTEFFDTETYPGERALFSYYASGIIECAAIAAGGDPKDLYPIDLEAAFAELDKIKDDVVLYDTVAQAADMMQNQDVATGIFLTTSLRYALREGAPFEASTEWAARGTTAFGIPMGAPNADTARAFLESLTDPEVNRAFSAEGAWTYGSPYGGPPSDAAVEAGFGDLLPTSPVMDQAATDIDWTWWGENTDEIVDRWSAFAQG